MRIIELRAENFKRLRAVEIAPDGNLVEIRGRNGQGKSSILDGIGALFASAGALPKRPVRDGAEQGLLSAKIGEETVEFIVTRRMTAENGTTSLTVEAPNGARFPSPQRVLDGLIGAISFDPLEFARAKPKVQLDELRRIVKLDVDPDALDGLNRRDYEARTDLNREATKLRGQIAGMATAPELPAEPIDTGALITEMESASRHNREIEERKVRRDAAAARVVELRADAADRREQAEALMAHAAKLEAQAGEIERQLQDAPALPDPIDAGALAEKLRDAQRINDEIGHRDRAAVVEAEAVALERRSQALTDAMVARTQQKAEALSRATFPVAGLSFGEGEILWNGIPFEQASQADKIRISVGVAIASNPKLRVLCVRDGSLLDKDSWKLLSDLITDSDFQCWIEVTDDDGKVGIVIEDGEVRGAPKPEPAAPSPARRQKAKPGAAKRPAMPAPALPLISEENFDG